MRALVDRYPGHGFDAHVQIGRVLFYFFWDNTKPWRHKYVSRKLYMGVCLVERPSDD